jgi:hypothetical protein
MDTYEYLAVPAPSKGVKIKGMKTASDRYAHQLTTLLNELAAEGWEYWRADTLASEERKGLTGTTRVTHELLIFRRPSADMLAAYLPEQSYPQHDDTHQSYGSVERTEPALGAADGYYEEDQSPRLTAPRRD